MQGATDINEATHLPVFRI